LDILQIEFIERKGASSSHVAHTNRCKATGVSKTLGKEMNIKLAHRDRISQKRFYTTN
jgi:hypothetical protein